MGLDLIIAAVVCGCCGVASRTRIGRRVTNLLQQKLGRLLDRAENPVEALDLAYQKQNQALLQVRRGLAEVVTSEKRLEMQASTLRQNQERLRGQARLALEQGREDLARLALTRAQAADTQLQQLDQQIEQLKSQGEKLELTSHQLQARVQAFNTQRSTLKAQYSAAQAAARIGETVTGLSDDMGQVTMMVQRAQDKTQQMQARAAAIDELMASGTLEALGQPGQDDIDRQLQAQSQSATIEAQLAELRRQTLAEPGQPGRISSGGETPS
ncbi:MAG: PspA/IM30 family protein [Candidatus Dormibacteria bacterium]